MHTTNLLITENNVLDMTAQTNGSTNNASTRKFENGVYTPLITPMTDDEQVDIAALRKQVVRLADAGMGLVLLGTNGEGEYPIH